MELSDSNVANETTEHLAFTAYPV